MTISQALILALVQGATEFLPVSSTGHLVLFQKLFNFPTPPIFFDVLLHFGTLGSILVFFRKDLAELIVNWKKQKKFWGFLILGSMPAVIAGLLFSSTIEAVFNSLVLVGAAWILFGAALLLTSGLKTMSKEMTWKDCLFVGMFQALALIPGISRSGTTISAGLARKLSRESAFKFSFLLGIPAIFGAAVWEMKDVSLSEISLAREGFSVLVAGLVGYLSLLVLRRVLVSDRFFLFGYYCLGLGTMIFLSQVFL